MVKYIGIKAILAKFRAELLAEIAIPPGIVQIWPGSQIPVGWFECDGRLLSKANYPGLYAAIGDLYRLSSDNDGTLFRIPDYRECAVVGCGTNITVVPGDSHDAYAMGEFKNDQLQDHVHGIRLRALAGGEGQWNPEWMGRSGDYIESNPHSTSVWGARTGSVTRGKRRGAYFIIKY